MKLVGAFFRLIRWPNLVFIALTQVLFYFCILTPSFITDFAGFDYKLNTFYFTLICFSSVLIAAGGYAINDYFDLNIDQINKPDKLIVEKHIRRRWAILWHLGFSITGVMLSAYVGWKINNWFLGIANLVCVALLWFYSTSFKKQLLIGNIVISLLTAWVVIVIWFCEIRLNNIPPGFTQVQSRLYKLVVLYASFAFIISLIREVVKDTGEHNKFDPAAELMKCC